MEIRKDGTVGAVGAAGGWVEARCPRCHDMLGEVYGADARLRKVCPRCRPKVLVVYDNGTGRYALEPVNGTAYRRAEHAPLAVA